MYCKDCLVQWQRVRPVCPLCNRQFTPLVPVYIQDRTERVLKLVMFFYVVANVFLLFTLFYPDYPIHIIIASSFIITYAHFYHVYEVDFDEHFTLIN